MKQLKYISLVILLCGSILQSNASSPEALMDSAAAAYNAEDFAKAFQFYSEVEKTHHSATLYYNMGNAAYKQGKIAESVLYYEKALKLNPADEDIIYNLEFANRKVSDDLAHEDESNIGRSFKSFIYAKPPSFWKNVTMLLIGGAFLFFIGRMFLKNRRYRIGTGFIATVALSLGVVGFFISLIQYSYLNSEEEGIIFSQVVNLRSAPEGAGTEVFVLHEGSKVIINERQGDWVRISLENGNTGWMHTTGIKPI